MNSNNHDNNSSSSSSSSGSSSSIEPLIRSILIKMNKLESLDEHVQYLRSEWYITIDDLRLALQDKTQWSELQLPGRLKIELKKELIKLNTINTNTATSDTINTTTATINNTISDTINTTTPINNTIITNNDKSDDNNNNSNTLQQKEEEEYNNNEIMNTPINTDSDINYDNELADIAMGNLSPNKWLKCFSPEHECFYYVSQVSGESQWEEPDPDEEIEEDEYSMALHAESLVDSNERLQYESTSYTDENDYGDEYNDNSFQPPLPPAVEEEEEQSYVYNAYESNWVYPSAPPVPIVPTIVHAIPLDTYLGRNEDILELPISNVRRQPQQPSPSRQQQQQQSSPYNQFETNSDEEDDDEEELSSDEEAYVHDNAFDVDESLVEQLVEMGFDKNAAQTELNRCKNQIDTAIARLVRLNERNSRNVRIVQNQVPNNNATATNTSNNRRTFLGKVIPKVPKVPINLFGKSKKNVDRSDENR